MDHKTYFDNIADRWDDITAYDKHKLRIILSEMNLFRSCRILDAGCGTGIFTEYILMNTSFPSEIICMDISSKMLTKAKERLSRMNKVRFLQSDTTSISLEKETIDRIICYSCFPHFTDKKSTIRNFYRILKSGGILVIAHGSNYKKINEMHSRLEEPVKNDLLPCPGEMKNILESADFNKISIIDNEDVYIVSARKI